MRLDEWPRKAEWKRCFLEVVRDDKALDVLMYYGFRRRSERGYVALKGPEGRISRVYLEDEGFLTCTCADYLYRQIFSRR